MKNIFRYLLAIAMLIPMLAQGHGPVTTLTQVSGEYTVEFEYNTLGSIFTGDYTIFDTYLLKAGLPMHYDSAFIRIQKQNGPAVMAGSLAESADNAGFASMSGVIHDAGAYTAELSFYQEGKKIAGGEFVFEAKDYPTDQDSRQAYGKYFLPVGLFLIGVILGGVGIWFKKFR